MNGAHLFQDAPRSCLIYVIRMLLFGFACGAENGFDFVLVEFFHVVACRAQIFAGVEFGGFVMEHFADGGGHGKTAVGVDVDLAHCALGGFAELLFGNANGVGEFAAVGVDGVNFVLGHGG